MYRLLLGTLNIQNLHFWINIELSGLTKLLNAATALNSLLIINISLNSIKHKSINRKFHGSTLNIFFQSLFHTNIWTNYLSAIYPIGNKTDLKRASQFMFNFELHFHNFKKLLLDSLFHSWIQLRRRVFKTVKNFYFNYWWVWIP